MTFQLRLITGIEFGKASRGWNCDIHFRIQTRRQFTMECHSIRGYGRQGWPGIFGIASAFWDAYRRTKAECARLQALPGEWNLDGTRT